MQENQDEAIRAKAVAHAKSIRRAFAKEEISPFPTENSPVTLLMAGSPGAGKTEVALEMLEQIGEAVHIDTDKYRSQFEDYNGQNAHLFQGAASILAEKVIDEALKKKVSFILDGTLSNYDKAKDNIKRFLGKDRKVIIFYIYQDPIVAWDFVLAREKKEGRRILSNIFIEQYFDARAVVDKLKSEFKEQIQLEIIIKTITNKANKKTTKRYIRNARSIEMYIPESYNRDQLKELINEDSQNG